MSVFNICDIVFNSCIWLGEASHMSYPCVLLTYIHVPLINSLVTLPIKTCQCFISSLFMAILQLDNLYWAELLPVKGLKWLFNKGREGWEVVDIHRVDLCSVLWLLLGPFVLVVLFSETPSKTCFLCTNQVCGCVEDRRRRQTNKCLGHVVFNMPTTKHQNQLENINWILSAF